MCIQFTYRDKYVTVEFAVLSIAMHDWKINIVSSFRIEWQPSSQSIVKIWANKRLALHYSKLIGKEFWSSFEMVNAGAQCCCCLLLWFINKNCSIFSLAQQHSIMNNWKKKSNSRMIALILVINARICLYVLKICCWNPNRTYMIKHDNQNIQTIVQLSMFCCSNWAWFEITDYDYYFFCCVFCCLFLFRLFFFINKQSTIKWCIICRYSIILDCFTSISSMALFPTALWNNRKSLDFLLKYKHCAKLHSQTEK